MFCRRISISSRRFYSFQAHNLLLAGRNGINVQNRLSNQLRCSQLKLENGSIISSRSISQKVSLSPCSRIWNISAISWHGTVQLCFEAACMIIIIIMFLYCRITHRLILRPVSCFLFIEHTWGMIGCGYRVGQQLTYCGLDGSLLLHEILRVFWSCVLWF